MTNVEDVIHERQRIEDAIEQLRQRDLIKVGIQNDFSEEQTIPRIRSGRKSEGG